LHLPSCEWRPEMASLTKAVLESQLARLRAVSGHQDIFALLNELETGRLVIRRTDGTGAEAELQSLRLKVEGLEAELEKAKEEQCDQCDELTSELGDARILADESTRIVNILTDAIANHVSIESLRFDGELDPDRFELWIAERLATLYRLESEQEWPA
jgi:hypothetical protein